MSAIFQTTGNDTCHVILRGGTRTGPNYDAEHVGEVCARLGREGLRETVMIDCSHGNSLKDHRRQAERGRVDLRAGGVRVVADLRRDAREPSAWKGGRTTCPASRPCYGQSITDACISLEQTEPLLDRFAAAQQARGTGRQV